ncbi:MAG: primosomal protein N' [Candidatus Omnitrophica bacterium]|nr:primosomal protein N' [Candidatus Omnitrophota bacterium]
MSPLFADVALGIPSASTPTFQYLVPGGMAGKIAPGCRVWVSMRTRRVVGYVTGLSQTAAVDEPKPIEGLIDEIPILDAPLLELTRWMSERYFCSWGQAIETALPAPFKKGKSVMKSRSPKTGDGIQKDAVSGKRELTATQDKACREILEKALKKETTSFLLHGITGSGKTEIYMQIIAGLLKGGFGAIVLVPEISLTPQTVERFYSRFGDTLAVIHSRLSQGRRVEEWHRIRKGEARVVVGARSAIFSPVRDLALIVIDEEHDTSYKQDETPRYLTRTVAAKRAELEGASLVMGSATPALETFYASDHGRVRRIFLPERIEKRPLPLVEVIDMRRQPPLKGRPRIFSAPLEENLRKSLEKKEQVMLFLNRRGFSTYLHCPSCGAVMTCPDCRISLAYHFDKHALFCHTCGHQEKPIKMCPSCKKSHLHYFGIGTQRVEEEVRRIFPHARPVRMDADSTAHRNAHESILNQFKNGSADVLIGTQMIAKGHDFPNVSLVGVISADTALHIPDFRAAEKTFSLLTQVSGRAGRGDIPGKVVVQTFLPTHYAIQSAKDHDYGEFYGKEIEFRRELEMPPFSSLIEIIMSGSLEREVARQILTLAKWMRERFAADNLIKIMGPAPCATSKVKGQFRWNLYLKGPSIEAMTRPVKEAIKDFKKEKVLLTVNVDPQ